MSTHKIFRVASLCRFLAFLSMEVTVDLGPIDHAITMFAAPRQAQWNRALSETELDHGDCGIVFRARIRVTAGSKAFNRTDDMLSEGRQRQSRPR